MSILIENLETYIFSYKPWMSILIVICSWMIYKHIHKVVARTFRQSEFLSDRTSAVDLAFNIGKYILVVILIFAVLNVNGVNVSSLTAGLGIGSIIIGFALQDILKDWIMGVSILWDNYFAVGDVVKFNNITGVVVGFNLKSTKVRDIVDGHLFTVSNRNISEVAVLSDWIDFDLYTPYEMTFAQMEPIIQEIVEEIKKLPHVTDCEYLNVSEFAASSINYRIRPHGDPEYRFATKRKCLSVVQKVYNKHGLQVPYTQLDIHMPK